MHAIHGADPQLTGRILDAWANMAANSWSGRRLPALFAAAGMSTPTVVAETVTSTDPHHPQRPPFTTTHRPRPMYAPSAGDSGPRCPEGVERAAWSACSGVDCGMLARQVAVSSRPVGLAGPSENADQK
jgi:hypothetical protein